MNRYDIMGALSVVLLLASAAGAVAVGLWWARRDVQAEVATGAPERPARRAPARTAPRSTRGQAIVERIDFTLWESEIKEEHHG